MSGPARVGDESADPALDAGVIVAKPLVEWNGWQAVGRHGGVAILPWRGDHLAATAEKISNRSDGNVPESSFSQALVRIQKGREATWQTLHEAWRALIPGGRLLVTGSNELGIVTWVKRLSAALQQPVEVLANHSRARVALFHRSAEPPQLAQGEVKTVPLWSATHAHPQPPSIVVPPGVFSHGVLDGGTALLVARLAEENLSPSPSRILDIGCGGGHLGLNALLRWPQAHACFVDADARAVDAVRMNLSDHDLGLHARATVAWWDVTEALPMSGFDLALANPPCHAGTAVDFSVARAMFRQAMGALVSGGRLIVVANRQLPYEADLAALGKFETLSQNGGFKLLAVRRP